MLILESTGARRPVIEQARTVQFGKTTEQLHAIFKELYGM